MSLATIVQELQSIPFDMGIGYGSSEQTDNPEALAILLVAIRECRAGLADFSDEVEHDLLALMDEKKLVVEGIGEIEAKKSIRRTRWDHEALLPAVVARLADEPGVFHDEDGTLFPYQTIGHNVARRLRECVSFGAGKVTGLRAIGMDPSEYCEEDDGHWSVKLPPRSL